MKDCKAKFEKRGLLIDGNFIKGVWKSTIFGAGKFVEVVSPWRNGFNVGVDYWIKTDGNEAENYLYYPNCYFIASLECKNGKSEFTEAELKALARELDAPKMLEILTKKGKFYRIVYKSGCDELRKSIFIYE